MADALSVGMVTTLRNIAAGLVAASGVLVLGCHSTEPRQPEVGLTKPVNPPRNPDLGRGAARATEEERYRIILGQDIGGICSGPSPYFDVNRSRARETSDPTMQNLADCMVSGPLTGKSIILIGHTDPRGSDELNDRLGAKRANDVRIYLIDHGVAADRVTIQTAGKRTASDDPKNWATDRRVEIRLDEQSAKSTPLEKER
jgi:peptidoglycan-associated lipoprotein